MKRVANYLYLRNGVFYFRITVPKQLRPYIGRDEIRISLREKNILLAEIKSTHLLAQMKRTFYEVAMSNDNKMRVGLITVFDPITEKKIAVIDSDEGLNAEKKAAIDILDAHNRSKLKSTSIDVAETKDSLFISTLLEQFINEHKESNRFGGRNNRTVTQYRNYLNLFLEYSGDIPVNKVSIELVKQYYSDLKRIPTNVRKSKKLKEVPLKTILKSDYERTLAPNTRKAYFEKLSSFMTWCENNMHIAKNPCRAVTKEKVTKSVKPREHFTRDELKQIFHSDYFQSRGGWYTKRTSNQSYRFWLPILAAFTGARRGELCDLRVSDLKQDSDGTYYLDINLSDEGKHLKTNSSIRTIPIHSQLIEIGFVDFVKSLNTKLIFHIQNKNKPGKSDPDNCGKKMSDLLVKLGVHNHTSHVFHSFRHTFANDLHNQKQPVEIISSMTGHYNAKSHAIAPEMMNTYTGEIMPMYQKEVIENLSYADILSDIRWKK